MKVRTQRVQTSQMETVQLLQQLRAAILKFILPNSSSSSYKCHRAQFCIMLQSHQGIEDCPFHCAMRRLEVTGPQVLVLHPALCG
jgi:hypothetical protein